MRRFTPVTTGIATLAILLTVPLAAQERADDSNRRSKNGLAEGSVGGASVTITYGRPKVNSRTVWGELEPYGAVWRAGADEATTITFSSDVTVEGTAVPKGTYGLFFIPNEGEWTVILNKVATQWGAFRYDQGQDLMRAAVKPMAADHMEELTYEVSGDGIELRWEKLAVPVRIGG
ncbi:MAG: DUF2911 domain-containing protein [Acidobacteriota bacterium]|nr:DUF2911 domain-containing protein [Acidobacteriota bacterium]